VSAATPLDALAGFVSFGIPERPSPKIDRALDATERCLARHGVRRTTMSDIAKEMGVSRPTLYKHVASVDEAIALIVTRQLYVFLDQVAALLAQDPEPRTFIDMAIRIVTLVRTHPVTERILTYEPELLGSVITGGQLDTYLGQVLELLTPLAQAAMDTGAVRSGDPRLTAELIVRLCVSLIVSPPAGELEPFVRYALEPLLLPTPGEQRTPSP
jgi:AcrR family transcriptional regulator